NPPAGEEVDRDVELVLGWHICRIAVPLENSLVDKVDILDEGDLDLQTGGSHRSADRPAKLSDNSLLDFAYRIDRTQLNGRHDSQVGDRIREGAGNLRSIENTWWSWEDSNFQPNDYQSLALSVRGLIFEWWGREDSNLEPAFMLRLSKDEARRIAANI